MKKDYDKRVFHNFRPFNTDEIEEYLNSMAEKGFFLLEITKYQMFFKQDTPRNVRYTLENLPNEESWTVYRNYVKTLGWDFVCTFKKFQVFSTEDETIPINDTDKTKFEVVVKERNKDMIYTILKLCALVIAAVFFSYNFGLVTSCLSVHGLCFTIMGIMYGILLISQIIDTVYWKIDCVKKLKVDEKISFRFSKITKRIQKVVHILLFVSYIIMFANAFYRLIISIQLNGIRNLYFMLVFILIYMLSSLVGMISRGELKKRGGKELYFYQVLFMLSWIVVCFVVINRYGSEVATYSPEKLGFQYDMNNINENIDAGKSILGSREYCNIWTFGEEGYENYDYSYYLYKSNSQVIAKLIASEALRKEHLSKYLKVYKQTEDYTIYTAYNKKIYPEDATYQTYDTDLEYNDGCIVIQSKNELLIFYYNDMDKQNADAILEKINYK